MGKRGPKLGTGGRPASGRHSEVQRRKWREQKHNRKFCLIPKNELDALREIRNRDIDEHYEMFKVFENTPEMQGQRAEEEQLRYEQSLDNQWIQGQRSGELNKNPVTVRLASAGTSYLFKMEKSEPIISTNYSG